MRDEMTEGLLVERLRQRDESALATCRPRYGTKIYQLAFRYMKNREDAEEVTQDVLHEGVPQGRRVPRRRGAVVLDLSHHVQHRDVAAAQRQVHARRAESVRARDAAPGSTTAGVRRARGRRLVAAGRRGLLRTQLRERLAEAMTRTAGDLPRRRSCCATSTACRTEEASRRSST